MNELFAEGQLIQQRLSKVGSHKAEQQLSRSFMKLMFEGKTSEAIQLLSSAKRGGILHLNDVVGMSDEVTVKEELLRKLPGVEPLTPDCILQGDPPFSHPVIFESLDAGLIRGVVLHTKGAAGPSGLDAYEWRRLCTSFKHASHDLCHALGLPARRIASFYVDPASIHPLLVCRLIVLDKCPGVRPIGVGEVTQRIIAKSILTVVRDDVQEAAGSVQLCAGQISGVEAAIHAVSENF